MLSLRFVKIVVVYFQFSLIIFETETVSSLVSLFYRNRSFGRHEMDVGGRLFEPKDPVTADRIYFRAFGMMGASVKSFWLGIHDTSNEGVSVQSLTFDFFRTLIF